MKNLKLLNKVYFFVILLPLFFILAVQSQEPVDIWNTQEEENIKKIDIIENLEEKDVVQNSVYEMQFQKNKEQNIEETASLTTEENKIVGLYDPEENGLDINMWSNSNGDQILNIYNRIDKLNLSKDASAILDILLLTNAYYPETNISKKQFFELKSKWLIKNSNFELIEKYLVNNQIVNQDPKLTKFLVDAYLSKSEVKKACQVFSNFKVSIKDDYLSKFNIYCLINKGNKEEAQLLIDLKKELGFSDKFFENKINYLMGYTNKAETAISEKTILDFHLSHRTNPEFKFEPKDSTSKQIWKYLSTSNLLDNITDIEITDINKIASIEKATHEGNYAEEDLFEIYKKFQFKINQLLNIKESTKVLSVVETRALIYQGILITTEISEKLQLMNALKNSFNNDNIKNAFDSELKLLLNELNQEDIPENFTRFYENYTNKDKTELTSIKINNKILHQSKLINYFKEEVPIKNITKDLNDLLRKVKKNKNYFFSKKDVILVEALKSDGIKVSNKYKNLYKIDASEIPSDIQIFINNKDIATAMLRIVEVIGQDKIEDIDEDTLFFIISTLNQLNVDPLRNKILLKVLPLKV